MQQCRVGLIGVGLMGHGIALNVQKAGYPLTLLDHPGNQPVDDLLEKGALTAPTPQALAGQVDVIIFCVTGSPQVEDAMFGPEGVVKGLQPGTLIIDCSTALPSSTLQVAAAVGTAGGRFIDAPMTRTPKEAAEGRLNLLVGGDEALFNEALPLLKSFAENVVHAGPVGSGHQMKLIHNFVSMGYTAVLAEAAACAARAGVSADVFVDILQAGAGRGVVLDRLGPWLTRGDGSGLQFATANALKDMTYYTQMAQEDGSFHGMADAARAVFQMGVDTLPDSRVPEIVGVLQSVGATKPAV